MQKIIFNDVTEIHNYLINQKTFKIFCNCNNEFLYSIQSNNEYHCFQLKSKEGELFIKKLILEASGLYIDKKTYKALLEMLEIDAYSNKVSYKQAKRVYVKSPTELIYDLSYTQSVVMKDGMATIKPHEKDYFLRSDTYLENCIPDLSACSTDLIPLIRTHFPFACEDDVKIFALYLVSAFSGLQFDFPILVALGPKGSCKSTFYRFLVSLIDPSSNDLLTLPKKEDLIKKIHGSYMTAIDNMLRVPPSLNPVFCQCSTGGNHVERRMYTNNEMITYELRSLLCLNGITMHSASDFKDRCIYFSFPRIDPRERRPLSDIQQEFESAKPKLLGSCLNTLAKVIIDTSPIKTTSFHRLADFHRFCIRVGKYIDISEDEVNYLLERNQSIVNEESIYDNALALLLISFMNRYGSYEGSMSSLYTKILEIAREENISTKLLPPAANIFSKEIKSFESELEEFAGIHFDIKRNNKHSHIHIYKIEK